MYEELYYSDDSLELNKGGANWGWEKGIPRANETISYNDNNQQSKSKKKRKKQKGRKKTRKGKEKGKEEHFSGYSQISRKRHELLGLPYYVSGCALGLF